MSLRSFLFCDDFSAMSGIYLVSVDRYQAIFHPLERQITRAQKHVQNSWQSCGSGEAGSNVMGIISPPPPGLNMVQFYANLR